LPEVHVRAVALWACLLGLAGTATASRPLAFADRSLEGCSDALVELAPVRGGVAVPALRAAGATAVSREPAIWKLRCAAARTLVPGLERERLVRSVAADRVLAPLGAGARPATVAQSEWWLRAVQAAGLTPPGPGKPVTVVDTGLDFSQPVFAGRPNTVPLNRQEITSSDDFHGTAISSLIGAQGTAIRGIYPKARLLEWDASERDGLTLSAIIAGIEAATRAGPGVINLSLGSDADVPMLDDVILEAFHKGSIVVAAGGDSRGFDFSPYPASYPHVLTVAATDRRDRAAPFSSPSSSIDIAAPGVDVTVAVPLSHDPSGYVVAAGTSYSAALVSGALAWIWTRRPELDNTQLIALVRRTAGMLGSGGFSNDTGYGLLDVRAALAAPAPPPDPLEPNDDVKLVRPGGTFKTGSLLLTTASMRQTLLRARLDQNKDPADVYRAWIPAHGRLEVGVRAQAGDVILRVWGPRTPTILERGGSEHRDLLATRQQGTLERVEVMNPRPGAEIVYIEVTPGVSRTASYSLTVSERGG
jgi:subtilisin family serine protease